MDIKKELKRTVVICISSLIMALNINSFVHTGGLYPGGVTGLTILLQHIAETAFGLVIPYTVVNLLLNAIPVYIGYRFIGEKFTLYSCLMIVLTSVFIDLFPGKVITYDTLLISIFGGMINGLAISLCLLVDATSGGTDFIAIFLSERVSMDSFNLILGFNAVIIGIAGVLYGWDKALYSIIFQYVSTQVLHALYRKYQKETLFIVTNKPKEVCSAIYAVSHHGATILEGEGAFEHCERNVVYSIVSASENKKVVRAIREADENAFINEMKTEQLSGSFYHKPAE